MTKNFKSLHWFFSVGLFFFYQRYGTNEYQNIFGRVKRSQMNILILKNCPWKINGYFNKWIYLSKIFEYIQISEYLHKIVLDFFCPFSYFCGVFFTQMDPFWTNNNHLYPFLGNIEHSNIFAIIDIGRINIQIYSSV